MHHLGWVKLNGMHTFTQMHSPQLQFLIRNFERARYCGLHHRIIRDSWHYCLFPVIRREESGHTLEHKANFNISINMDHDALMKTAVKVHSSLLLTIQLFKWYNNIILQDFSVLAQSSKRAERKDVEATAYASLGVIHDNQSNYTQVLSFASIIFDIYPVTNTNSIISLRPLKVTNRTFKYVKKLAILLAVVRLFKVLVLSRRK